MPVSSYETQELLGKYGSLDIFPNDSELPAVIVDLLSNCFLKSLLNPIYRLPKNRSPDLDTPLSISQVSPPFATYGVFYEDVSKGKTYLVIEGIIVRSAGAFIHILNLHW